MDCSDIPSATKKRYFWKVEDKQTGKEVILCISMKMASQIQKLIDSNKVR